VRNFLSTLLSDGQLDLITILDTKQVKSKEKKAQQAPQNDVGMKGAKKGMKMA